MASPRSTPRPASRSAGADRLGGLISRGRLRAPPSPKIRPAPKPRPKVGGRRGGDQTPADHAGIREGPERKRDLRRELRTRAQGAARAPPARAALQSRAGAADRAGLVGGDLRRAPRLEI